MNNAISVKCPECSNEFPLSDAVLSSVREGVTKELQSTLANREQMLSKRQRTLDDREADLKKKTSEIQQEAERLAEQRLKEREVHIKSEAAKQAVKEHEFVLKQLQEEVTEKTNALKQAQAHELGLVNIISEEPIKQALELFN